MNYEKLSKEVSYALRHAPWEYELELDDEGCVPIEQLLFALNESSDFNAPITQTNIEEMIACSEKKRHEIADGKIRAIYGHSTPQKILRIAAVPPDVLYHGTTHMALASIFTGGLKPMNRQYVHLSVDLDTAMSVGRRRDAEPVILQIDARMANAAGIMFYKGNEKVWLADNVPPQYISMTN